MKNKPKEGTTAYVAVLLMLAVFAVGILAVLLSGAGVYQRLTQRTAVAYDSRTCARYLTAKVQQAPGAVEIAPFGDGDALLLYETIGGSTYLTRVYCHDGWLKELFTPAQGNFSPEDGEKLLPAEALQILSRQGLLTVTVTPENAEPLVLKLRLPKEVQP